MVKERQVKVIRRFLILVISFVLLLNNKGVIAKENALYFEQNSNMIKKEAELLINAQLSERFRQYYIVNEIEPVLCCFHYSENGGFEIKYLVNVHAVLKYKCVEDMHYFKGLLKSINLDNYSAKIHDTDVLCSEILKSNSDIDNRENADSIACFVSKEYQRLSEFIGVEQIMPIYLMAKGTSINDIELYVDDGDEYTHIDEFHLSDEESLVNNGIKMMNVQKFKIVNENITLRAQSLADAARSNAIIYVLNHTSNPTYCDFHGIGSGCDALRDSSKWNKSSYPQENEHNDCANFMSQALFASGFSMTSDWYYSNGSGSVAWNTVSGITTKLLGRIGIAPSGVIAPGYLVVTNNGGHIMMVTCHDGVNYRYSGHTNDRKDAILNFSSGVQYYNVNYGQNN